MNPWAAFRSRFLDVLASIYIYNEHRGYTSLDRGAFEQLCRVIMLTEQRGMRQVEILLTNSHIRSDKALKRIFEVVEKDEPDHYLPYERWLTRNGAGVTAKWRERWADYWIHKTLMLVKLPAVFLNRSTPRLAAWPDEDSAAYA